MKRHRTRWDVSSSIVALFVTASTASAQAIQQAPPAASESEEQKEFAAGLSLGVGGVSFHPTVPDAPPAEPYIGIGVTLWGGWRYADRFGVSLDANIVDRSGAEYTQGTILIGLQYWATPRAWVKGGAGWGVLNAANTQQLPPDEYGPAFGVAVGTGLKKLRKLGIDIDAQVRFTQSHAANVRARSVAAQLGLAKRFAVSTITTTTPLTPPATPTPNTGRNLFGFEIIGRSGFVGFAYEREVGARVGLGVGAGVGWDIWADISPGLIPVYVSWSPIGDTHRLYTGAGVALVHVSSDFRDYFVNVEPRLGWSAYRTGSVGYEHRMKNNEGFWRLGLNIWYQPFGIPGGLLHVDDSGFALVPAYSIVWRF